MRLIVITILSSILLAGCIERVQEKTEIPVYGSKEILTTNEAGEEIIENTTLKIDEFEVMNQDSNIVTAANFKNKIYVVDFFFTHCPTICPVMTKNMSKVYDTFSEDNEVLFLSHTIDIKNDSVPQLKKYANKIGISSEKWHMVTADKKVIYDLAKQYMVSAEEDPNSPGGYMHSGAFILMDGQHRIRGYYDGTLEEDTDQIIADIKVLKNEGNER
ncbi:MAG: SCO family protein [Salibacteraceae bacterium]